MNESAQARSVIVFANGCFWCTEAIFSELEGVISVMSGYMSGAECLKVEYDPSVISFDDLLIVFFSTHNPTTLNRQGNNVGTEYRSAIFYSDEYQKEKSSAFIKKLNDDHAYDKPVVTEVQPLSRFYPAEAYHQNYYKDNPHAPYCEIVIAPKVEEFQKRFEKLLKQR